MAIEIRSCIANRISLVISRPVSMVYGLIGAQFTMDQNFSLPLAPNHRSLVIIFTERDGILVH